MGSSDESPTTPSLHEATLLMQEFLQMSARFGRMLSGELDVNATDFRVMEHLLRSGPLSPGELAGRLGISGAAMTTSIDRLTGRGHVRRDPDPDDRRRVRVVPSPASSERAAGFVTPMVRDLDAEMDRFSPAEQQAITSYLHRVVDTMSQHARVGDEEQA